ncbi:pyruvate, phosphate dikinase [Rickettsia endosymbiont of Polydrusus tereticollis]|uniref:pyruvate, phosphate dikinase n=1 Tax=Rickettsia endosymbiont of Polydrusus tereticollis TaxID=3066251 RepID=UPI0031329E3E
MNKLIYYFGASGSDGNASMKNILGNKGAGLAEMSNLNLPIPDGFTITTELYNYFYNHNHSFPKNFSSDLKKAIKKLEVTTGKIFGDSKNPLLLSVRSGSTISMPGMMDTVLNLGMNDEVCTALAISSNDKRFALDSYKRFLEMYGSTVLSIQADLFDQIYEAHKIQANIYRDNDVTIEILEKIIEDFKKIIIKHKNQLVSDPYQQLESAIKAVLQSWMSNRAVIYRRIHNIAESFGTAINIQSMVFGNLGNNSATGVAFTRSPSTGEKGIFGEFLINAQGEDIVSGTRTPFPIVSEGTDSTPSMQIVMPKIFAELEEICKKLELHYLDMQDIEFTIENNKLYILQTRSAKRTALASIKIAVQMVQEKLISKDRAIMHIDPESLNQLLHTRIDYSQSLTAITEGLPASPGAATGIVVFSPYDAEKMSHHHKVILVRHDTSPEDINGMHVSSGILTVRGGMTSHAAVVARGMGKPCVCGTNNLIIDEKNQLLKAGDITIKQGETITIDGGTGKVFLGAVPLIQPVFTEESELILTWADEISHLKVRANAETVTDAAVSLKFGAKGIGLCRTEHMFFDKNKIPLVREMIIAPDIERRKRAIDELLPLQIEDFKALFRIMQGKPINIRLLDPPLHEFLPTTEFDKQNLADNLNLPLSLIRQRLHAMHETNPMLGHRGCRLGISSPEIYQMQIEAIFTAIYELHRTENIDCILELMIPLISNVNEIKKLKSYIYEVVNDLENRYKYKFSFTIGTMIELPRAALNSREIAKEVDYFSFGTNDLTQTTYGISRDDVASFFPYYLEEKIFDFDPFTTLDEEGVGELIEIAIKRGKASNANLKLGACGEHAGNPTSIDFFHRMKLDYISCSPYRIPIARIAAAQAKIKYG